MSKYRILLSGVYLTQKKKEVNTINELIFLEEEEEEIQKEIKLQEVVDIACWNCGLFFSGISWGIPLFMSKELVPAGNKYELYNNLPDGINMNETNIIKYHGNFCMAVCSMRYLLETIDIPEHNKPIYKKLLLYVYGKKIGRNISFIPPAHPKTIMKLYTENGISEEEYKEKNRILEKNEII